MVFDGRPVKLWAGVTALRQEGGQAFTFAWGMKLSAYPWLDFDVAWPWKQSGAPARGVEEAVSVSGAGDISIAGSFDFLELVNPSLVLRDCEGWVFWKAEDHFQKIKNPHLSLSASLSIPSGASDLLDADGCEPLDARFQPGTGVFIPSFGLDYSQGLRNFTPGLGLRGSFPIGEDPTGLRRFPSWSFSAGATYRIAGKTEALAFDAGLSLDWTPFDSVRDGAAVPGGAGLAASARVGCSVGLGRGFCLVLSATWNFWGDRPSAEEPFEQGIGAALHLVMPGS